MINSATQNDILTIHLNGDFDALAVEQMRSQFDEVVGQQQPVTLNMKSVEFIDSSGIGAIVFLFKRLRSHDLTLMIEEVHGQPLELMQYLRIDKCIDLHQS